MALACVERRTTVQAPWAWQVTAVRGAAYTAQPAPAPACGAKALAASASTAPAAPTGLSKDLAPAEFGVTAWQAMAYQEAQRADLPFTEYTALLPASTESV